MQNPIKLLIAGTLIFLALVFAVQGAEPEKGGSNISTNEFSLVLTNLSSYAPTVKDCPFGLILPQAVKSTAPTKITPVFYWKGDVSVDPKNPNGIHCLINGRLVFLNEEQVIDGGPAGPVKIKATKITAEEVVLESEGKTFLLRPIVPKVPK